MAMSNIEGEDERFGNIRGKVQVIDALNEWTSFTTPANARKILSQGRAFILAINPFIIKMKGGSERTGNMVETRFNFTEYFRDEKDVWVQNIGKTQISIGFEVAPGRSESVCLPRTKKPWNLSSRIPWRAIRDSMDLRTILNRRPAKLAILSKEQVDEYYRSLAAQKNTSVDAEMDAAMEEITALLDKRVYTAPEGATPKTIEEKRVEAEAKIAPDEVVSPGIVGLIQKCDKLDAPAKREIPVNTLMEELEVLMDGMTRADFEYVIAKAPKTAATWASEKLGEKFPSQE